MPARILLIDEDIALRESISASLTSHGYIVVAASDCAQAMFLPATERFDLILLDNAVPDNNDALVVNFLRESHGAARVLVVTGVEELHAGSGSGIPGIRQYIKRPFNLESLLEAVKHALSGMRVSLTRLQIIHAGDLIRSTPTGDLDIVASTKGFALIAATGAALQDFTVLLDLRGVKSHLSLSDIYGLAAGLGEYGNTFRRKTALLARADKAVDSAEFFGDVAHNRGFNVKVFTDFEAAIIWLSKMTEHTAPPEGEKILDEK
jgi:CheY-like chemotaxis protein